jgi:hypothetical protein
MLVLWVSHYDFRQILIFTQVLKRLPSTVDGQDFKRLIRLTAYLFAALQEMRANRRGVDEDVVFT